MRFVKNLFIAVALLFLFPAHIHANNFGSDIDNRFEITEKGRVHATFEIKLTNKTTESYAASYSLLMHGVDPQSVRAFNIDGDLNVKVAKIGTVTEMNVILPNPVVGKGNSQNFTITFQDETLVRKTGEVWEITLPEVDPENIDSIDTQLYVPQAFGELAYMSPDPLTKIENKNNRIYYFSKESFSEGGVSAGFGQFQIFDFKLIYHLENPISKPYDIQISLPPDTAYQRIFYESISPEPDSIKIDGDGNWMATYRLAERERIDITALGSVQVFADPWAKFKTEQSVLQKNIAESEYWQTSSNIITSIADNLDTPLDIYNYVVDTLNYDYERARPEIKRKGAEEALLTPDNAICMEFTDVFVALARAKGIPAREINGFAYTENKELQPLSLVSDVLHAWPEYWDSQKEIWVPIDPTWGDTTGGTDFFNKFDLRHIVFAIHGVDPIEPYPAGSYKLGGNPQKDVFVSFGKFKGYKNPTLDIKIKRVTSVNPFKTEKYKITLKNIGAYALYNESLIVKSDQEETSRFSLPPILPYQTVEREISIPVGLFGKNMPGTLTAGVAGVNQTVETNKTVIIAIYVIGVSMLLFLFALLLFLAIRRTRTRK